MKYTATIFMRAGGVYCTELTADDDPNAPTGSLGRRMAGGGFIVCTDARWGKERTLIINAADVAAIELVEQGNAT